MDRDSVVGTPEVMFFSSNPFIAAHYAEGNGGRVFEGRLSLEPLSLNKVYDLEGRHLASLWPSQAAHANDQPDHGVLIVKKVHDHGFKYLPAHLLSDVYSTREWRERFTQMNVYTVDEIRSRPLPPTGVTWPN